jgi:hypothetical protein
MKTMTPPHSSDPAAIAEYLIPRIDRALAIFRSLKYSPTAAPRYELLSDSIYWDDEVPPNPDADVLAIIRHILRTRIELAHSSGNDPTWNHFKKHVPTWPGFRPERCGEELLKLYAQGRSDKQLADE